METVIGGIALGLLVAYVIYQARRATPPIEPDALPGGRDEDEPSAITAR